ncbi:MAG: DNA polymerase III subunit delta [bacterium]
MPVLLYWGEEDFNLEKSVNSLKEKILDPDWAVLNHKILNELSVRNLTEVLMNLPMAFGNVLIEVHSTKLFMRSSSGDETEEKSKFHDADIKKFLDTLSNINPNVYVLFKCIVPRNSKRKINSASKIVKHIQTIGKIEEFKPFQYWEGEKVVSWMSDNAKLREISISKEAATILFNKMGTDLRRLDMELEKLKLYIHPSKKIEAKHIEIINDEKEDIFKLADLWLTGKKTDSMKELSKVLEDSHPLMVIATLTSTVRKWIKLKQISSKTQNKFDISKAMGIPPNFVERDLKNILKITPEALIKMKKNLYETEVSIKSGKMQAETALEVLLLL